MKKIIVFLFIFIIVFLSLHQNQQVKIPEDAIRFRIIASSDSLADQNLKIKIRDDLIPILTKIEQNSTNQNSSKKIINEQIPEIKKIINRYNINYDISYGKNFFPEKVYQNTAYNAGNYDSLVITLGPGKGQNWWCVLFPPLCLIEANKDTMSKVDYDLYINKILRKYA
jgi:stage II sporulation protein R